MTGNILIVDDEDLVLKSLQRVFRREEYNVYLAESGAKALEIMQDIPIELIITDQRMPQMTGTDLLKIVKERWPQTVRIILSGYAEVEAVLAAINVGEVYRFVTKPWEDNALRTVVRNALEQGKLVKVLLRLIERLRLATPERQVAADFRTDEGRVHAEISDHGKGMDEKQVASVLKCIFDFFEANNDANGVAMISSTLTKYTGKLSFTTEVGAGAKLVIDMPIENK